MTVRGMGGERQRVAVLTPHWGLATERGTITRQVAGALACSADVHVITPRGRAAGTHRDGVFDLHQLGTSAGNHVELRRDLLLAAMTRSAPSGIRPGSHDLNKLLDRGLIDSWAPAAEELGMIRPDLVVLADHRNTGALAALEAHDSGVPTVLLALAAHSDHLAFSHFDPVVERATQVLTVTETERRAVVERFGRDRNTHRIGAPLSANPSAFTEPNGWVGDTGYILVLTDRDSEAAGIENELADLVRMRFTDRPVGITHTDGFFAWHAGRVNSGWPVERSSDLARLLAFAAVTVDLRLSELYGRPAVESLLYRTPIVVPQESRAREHAQRGRGGLWFSDAAEMIWCIESLLDPATSDAVSSQGRVYAEAEYGSTERFIDRVTASCGLDVSAIPEGVRDSR